MESGPGHSSPGVTGLETWAARQGPGGAALGPPTQTGVPSGRRPALIGTRCRAREPSRAPLILPGVPATGRGQRRAGCRLSQVWGLPGGMVSYVVAEQACHPARGEARALGARWQCVCRGVVRRLGIPQLASVRLLETGSRTPGSKTPRISEALSSACTVCKCSLYARHSAEHLVQFNSWHHPSAQEAGFYDHPTFRQ